MPLFKCNLNNYAYVRLTPAGERAWAAYWKITCEEGVPESVRSAATMPDGTVRFQLHTLIHIFGPMIRFGNSELPFVKNDLEIDTNA
jgi:hypothetical protein